MLPVWMGLLVLQPSPSPPPRLTLAEGTERDLSPRVARLLGRAEPPPQGTVRVALLVSGDTVVVGEQVDLVTVAWFPRELVTRSRRPPSLRPPTVDGTYRAVPPSAARAVLSRQVDGQWYDLYVAPQIVFPLRAGELRIPPAELSYTVAPARSFGDERRFEHRSPARTLTVVPPPAPPADGSEGPVARELALAYEVPAELARAGEPFRVDLVLTGLGNLALWPPPAVSWPEGSRGYAGSQAHAPRIRDGWLGGTKRFSYVLVPDSSGTLTLPELHYGYYDPTRRAWRVAVAQAVLLPVQPRAPPTAGRGARPAMPLLRTEPWSLRVLGGPALAVLAMLVLMPPLWAAALAWRQRGQRDGTAPALAGAAHELERLIRLAVPDPADRQADRLAARLREVGVDSELSAEAAEVYRSLTRRRFDPRARQAREDGSDVRAERVVAGWPNQLRVGEGAEGGEAKGGGARRDRGGRARGVETGAVVLLLALPVQGPGMAQVLAGDSLYRAGAYAAAAEELFRAATAAASSARLWYNAGAAAWAAEQDARAAAAWLRARQLAPRSPTIASAWAELTRRATALHQAGPQLPVTPVELLLLAGLMWATGWVLLMRGRRVGAASAGVLTLLLVSLAGALALSYQRPIAIAARPAPLRDLPHGQAQELDRVEELEVVRIRSRRAGWLLVEQSDGSLGWIPEAILVEVRRLDFAP